MTDLMSTFAGMACLTGARMGGAHSGTLQRGSSLVPAANTTLKPAFRRTVRDIILSFVSSVNTKVVPRVANAYGFFDSVRIG